MNKKPVILAVDDTSESLALIVKALSGAEYDVRPADSGELALAAAAAQPPDLVLLDVRMKGVDGIEVLRRFKSAKSTQDIPVILISAFANVSEWVEGLKLGASDYVTKPFQVTELLVRVRTHLALRKANTSLAQQAELLRRTNDQLTLEIIERDRIEDELRRSIKNVERARKEVLSALEDRKRAEEQAVVRARQQAAIAELGQLALTGVDLQAVLDQVVQKVAQVLEVEFCKVLELLPDRSGVLLRAGIGWKEGLVGRATVGIGLESQAGFTLQSKVPVVVDDLRTEKRFSGPSLLRDHHVISGLSTCIGDIEHPYGVLGAHTTRQRAFTAEDVYFLESATTLVANLVQRKAHEREIERLTRIYATLSQVNQCIVRVRSREELAREVCQIAIKFGGFKLAWIGQHDAVTGDVTPVACAGEPQEFLHRIRHTSREDTQHGCLCGPAIRNGSCSATNDLRASPQMQSWLAYVNDAGLYSAAILPIRLQGAIWGVFGIYAAEPDIFQDKEIALLEEAALDISFALDHLAHEEQRKEAEARVAAQLDELRRWHDTTLGRETRVLQLKQEVNQLLANAGKPIRYPSVEDNSLTNPPATGTRSAPGENGPAPLTP